VEIDHLEGRTTVGLVTPYPPGYSFADPGEVFNKKIVDYASSFHANSTPCVRDSTDMHGLVEEKRQRHQALFRRLRARSAA